MNSQNKTKNILIDGNEIKKTLIGIQESINKSVSASDFDENVKQRIIAKAGIKTPTTSQISNPSSRKNLSGGFYKKKVKKNTSIKLKRKFKLNNTRKS